MLKDLRDTRQNVGYAITFYMLHRGLGALNSVSVAVQLINNSKLGYMDTEEVMIVNNASSLAFRDMQTVAYALQCRRYLPDTDIDIVALIDDICYTSNFTVVTDTTTRITMQLEQLANAILEQHPEIDFEMYNKLMQQYDDLHKFIADLREYYRTCPAEKLLFEPKPGIRFIPPHEHR